MIDDVVSGNDEAEFHPIPVELFSRRSNRTTQLINNSEVQKFIDGKRQWYEYDFEKPVYIQAIQVVASGYESWNEIEYEVQHIDGTKHEQKIRFNGEQNDIAVGKLASGFKFRPDTKYSLLSSQAIKRVVVVGLSLDEFHAFEWAVKKFEDDKRSFASRESDLVKREGDYELLSAEKASLDAEVGKSKAELSQLISTTEANSTQFSALNSSILDEKQSLTALQGEQRKVREDIVNSESRLTVLTKELRLFPSEIAGFVQEGNRNIWWYLGISTPFVAVIFIVLNALFSSAIDLTQIWRREAGIDIWTIFITRLPFVIVALALLEVCGYIVGRLKRIAFDLNREGFP